MHSKADLRPGNLTPAALELGKDAGSLVLAGSKQAGPVQRPAHVHNRAIMPAQRLMRHPHALS